MKLAKACILAFWVLIAGVSANSASAQIVVLGASNAQGYGVGASEAFPAVLESMLHARGSNVHVTNAGIAGDTTAGMLGRLSSAVPEGTRVVIVQYGGNDFRRNVDPAVRKDNKAKIEQQLQARGIRVVHADPLVNSALRSGMVMPDGQHLTVAGHQKVAAQLAGMVR